MLDVATNRLLIYKRETVLKPEELIMSGIERGLATDMV